MPAPAPALDRIRRICLDLPETTERASHGTPTFFVRGRQFTQYWNGHHDDPGVFLWCAAAPGRQGALVKRDPARYFVPPYVGYRGWIGVRLDRGFGWDDVAARIEEAYLAVAPAALGKKIAGAR